MIQYTLVVGVGRGDYTIKYNHIIHLYVCRVRPVGDECNSLFSIQLIFPHEHTTHHVCHNWKVALGTVLSCHWLTLMFCWILDYDSSIAKNTKSNNSSDTKSSNEHLSSKRKHNKHNKIKQNHNNTHTEQVTTTHKTLKLVTWINTVAIQIRQHPPKSVAIASAFDQGSISGSIFRTVASISLKSFTDDKPEDAQKKQKSDAHI